MPSITMKFTAGRYHATPGGSHVHEGSVEWPPSPWRIVRALVATGYTKLGWSSLPPAAERLFASLCRVLPRYGLPPVSLAHSRHDTPQAPPLLDTWANVEAGELTIDWPVTLDDDAYALMSELIDNLSYLGRSESLVDARINPPADEVRGEQPGYSRSTPTGEGGSPGPGWEQVALLAPERPDAFAKWRTSKLSHALADLPLPSDGKKPSKRLLHARDLAAAPFPDTVLDALQWDTSRWKAQGWGQPPGSRKVLYWRRSDALEIAPPQQSGTNADEPVEAMLLALATPSRNRGALPHIARTLPQAELLHRAFIERSADSGVPEVLTGKDAATNTPLKGHQHAYVLPLDLDADGQLDHVLVHARMGLNSAATRAIRGVRRTWQKQGPDLDVAVAGSGSLKDLRQLQAPLRAGILNLLGPEAGARQWQSWSPFVAPRYVKARGSNSLEGQVVRELEHHGHPPAQVEVLPWSDDNLELRHFIRTRKRGGHPPPVDCGYVLRLSFEQPVSGPIVLGYGSHFGLGMFRAL